jgi:cytochrome P450
MKLDIFEKKYRANEYRGGLAKDTKWYFPMGKDDSSLLIADDEEHRLLRRVVAPSFSEKAMQEHENVLKSHAEKLVATLRRESETSKDGTADVVKWFTFMAADVMGERVFGESFNGLETGRLIPFLEMVSMAFTMVAVMREMNRYPAFILQGMMAMVPKKAMEQRKEVGKWAPEAVERRVSQTTERDDIMAHVIQNKDKLTNKQVEGIAITMTIGGIETIATALSGVFFFLCTHRDELHHLTRALRTEFTTEAQLDHHNLKNHEDLNAVILETLRLYPPFPDFLYRRTAPDQAVVVDGQVVPGNTVVTMNLWAVSRSAKNFHRPLDFVPARWKRTPPEEYRNDVRSASKPFSTGPRDCVGQK